eukprot:comp7445_c0_seq1/m.3115 comp7445_c0_seq1/g.3115  ORF comp7445_c0_seq1/g.3115 comp7445_c0_seq1/m.3115 type:complete len:291 (-) comp7445_c0_seq1:230-1102(-)
MGKGGCEVVVEVYGVRGLVLERKEVAVQAVVAVASRKYKTDGVDVHGSTATWNTVCRIAAKPSDGGRELSVKVKANSGRTLARLLWPLLPPDGLPTAKRWVQSSEGPELQLRAYITDPSALTRQDVSTLSLASSGSLGSEKLRARQTVAGWLGRGSRKKKIAPVLSAPLPTTRKDLFTSPPPSQAKDERKESLVPVYRFPPLATLQAQDTARAQARLDGAITAALAYARQREAQAAQAEDTGAVQERKTSLFHVCEDSEREELMLAELAWKEAAMVHYNNMHSTTSLLVA